MSGERNTEIWSTRLQRELLALTTENAPEGTKEEVKLVLPPFVTVKEHKLDIEHGNCAVMFQVDLPVKKEKPAEEKPKEEEEKPAEEKPEEEKPAEGESESDAKEAEAKQEDEDIPTSMVVTLDASLNKKPDGSVDPIAVAYPFLKPVAILTSGSKAFPKGSTIKDGDFIDIEMDWTPSLHLTDAILNISLKIKESILQGEPFYPSESVGNNDPVDEMVNKAKRFGASFTQGLRGMAHIGGDKPDKEKKGLRIPGMKKKEEKKKEEKKKKKAPKANPGEIRIGDEINMLEAPWVDCQGVYSCKAIRRPTFVEEAMDWAAQNQEQGEPQQQQQQVRSIFEQDDGDVPEDIGSYMRLQAGSVGQVAGAGFSGAGAMFRTFTQSARSVLEESFLMITDTHIIEMKSNKLNLSSGIVTFAITIDVMAKLKFRRQESISLFFKPAPDDPLIYMCPDSADAVHQIQAVLKRHGVKGKHTNAATHRAINQALHLVQEIQTKELALKHDPTIERVNEIMDLYRQAAERFEVAGDVRHEEVVTHMRKFLALPLTVSILDGSYKKPEGEESLSNQGEGVVLDTSYGEDREGAAAKTTKPRPRVNSDDRAFEENMDSILKEAEEDMAHITVDDDEDPELDAVLSSTAAGGGDDSEEELDAIFDFETMLKEADDELNELMSS